MKAKKPILRLSRMSLLPGVFVAALASSCDGGREYPLSWQGDIRYFEDTLEKNHPDLFFQIPKETYHQQIDELYQSSLSIEEHDIVLELARIMAMMVKGKDSHTTIWLNSTSFFNYLPFWLRWFSDGLYVIGADSTSQQAVGKRVINIGDMSVDEAHNKVADYISHSNEMWAKKMGADYMGISELLYKIRVSDDPNRARLTLEDEVQNTTEMLFETSKKIEETFLSSFREEELPLYQQNRGLYYWYEYIEAEETIYVKYRRCRNMDSKSFADFSEELFEFIDANKVEKLIFDIRQNTGGNSEIIWPFIRKVQQHPSLNHKDRFFVVISGLTFSSGVHACVYLDNSTDATFIGEPTGGKPTNIFGDIGNSFTLPYSKLKVTCSSKFFDLSSKWEVEDLPSFMPDIMVELSSDDYFSLRDPVLQYIFDYY